MIKDLLVGLNVPPVFVGLARAIILAAGAAAVGAAITFTEAADWGEYAKFSPFVLLVLRFLEGSFDQGATPNQNDTPPADLAPAQ